MKPTNNVHLNAMNEAMRIARAKRIGRACEIFWVFLMLCGLFCLGMMAFADVVSK